MYTNEELRSKMDVLEKDFKSVQEAIRSEYEKFSAFVKDANKKMDELSSFRAALAEEVNKRNGISQWTK